MMRTFTSFRCAAVLLMILGIAGGSLPAAAQTPTSAADQAPAFRTIHMVSQTSGWAIVTVPDPAGNADWVPGEIYPGTLAYLVHTEDGGQNWTNETPTTLPGVTNAGGYGCDCSDNGLTNAFFLDDNHAWAMFTDGSFPYNQLFYAVGIRATDSHGQTWKTSVEGLDGPFVIASSFIDALNGWLLVGGIPSSDGDEPAMLFRTIDGGMSWQFIADDGKHSHLPSPGNSGDPISSPATGVTPMYHQGMAFESATSGWLLVTDFDPGDSDLLHSTDGGVTWKVVRLTPDSTSAHSLDDCPVWELNVFAPGEITFLASCHDGTVVLYHSGDDGSTWQSHPIPVNVLNLAQPKPLFMLNATTAWAIGCDPAVDTSNCTDPTKPAVLNKTEDGGNTWDMIGKLPDAFTTISNESNIIGTQFDFINDQVGWAIDPAGGLYATRSAGKTWTAIQAVLPGLKH